MQVFMSLLSMSDTANGGVFEGFAFPPHDEESDVEGATAEEEQEPMGAPGSEVLAEQIRALGHRQEEMSRALSTMVEMVSRQNENLSTQATTVQVTSRDITHSQDLLRVFETALAAHAERLVKVDTAQHEGNAQVREMLLKVEATINDRLNDRIAAVNAQINASVKEALEKEVGSKGQSFQNAFTIIGWCISVLFGIATAILGFLLATHH